MQPPFHLPGRASGDFLEGVQEHHRPGARRQNAIEVPGQQVREVRQGLDIGVGVKKVAEQFAVPEDPVPDHRLPCLGVRQHAENVGCPGHPGQSGTECVGEGGGDLFGQADLPGDAAQGRVPADELIEGLTGVCSGPVHVEGHVERVPLGGQVSQARAQPQYA